VIDKAIELIAHAKKPLIVQAENPDADSLASALTLGNILGDLGKQPSLYCSVAIPKYLRYIDGWDRVNEDLPDEFDLTIIVDTSSYLLLERLFEAHGPAIKRQPLLVIDHHTSEDGLGDIAVNLIDASAVSTGQVVFNLAKAAGWKLDKTSAGYIAITILSDSLGLTSPKTSAESIKILAETVELGADLSAIDDARREFNKKPMDIFLYKGRLFERVETALDGRLAMATIPWEEIEKYSDAYNPSMLIIDEMRLIEGVEVAAVFKTYPDGKITVKLRANSQARFMDRLAGRFGGGGHPYAAGFKVYDTPFEALKSEFISAARELLEDRQ